MRCPARRHCAKLAARLNSKRNSENNAAMNAAFFANAVGRVSQLQATSGSSRRVPA